MKIAPDKWKHFFAGILMGTVLQAAGWWILPAQLIMVSIVAFIIIIMVSYGFELYSKITGHGHYEVMDAVASVIGGLLGMGIILALQLS
jgi:hypothetical protein